MNITHWSTLALSIVAFSATSHAAGLWLHETGTEDLGTATAGRAATANDSSIAGGNPAGMPLLSEEHSVTATMQMLYVNARFDSDTKINGGGDGGNAGGLIPSGSASYAYKHSDDLSFGLSLGSYFGLGLDYGDDWEGRYYVTEAELLTVGVNPSVGYRINERWLIGGGVNFFYSKLDQRAAVKNVANPDQGDGRLKLEDDAFGYGINLGLMFELSDDTRIGLSYRSQVDLEFDDALEFSNLGPALKPLEGTEADLDLNVPQSILLGIHHDINDDWAIMASIAWQEWSEFGKQELSITSANPTEIEKDLEFDDTWHFALGAQYQINPELRWSFGISHDTSPIDKAENRTPDVPFDRIWRFASGLNYQWKENVTVGIAYEYMDLGPAEIDVTGNPVRGDLKGEYDTNAVHFFAANFNWAF